MEADYLSFSDCFVGVRQKDFYCLPTFAFLLLHNGAKAFQKIHLEISRSIFFNVVKMKNLIGYHDMILKMDFFCSFSGQISSLGLHGKNGYLILSSASKRD
jgi:hypothetical protein